jgi:hypothetical protein
MWSWLTLIRKIGLKSDCVNSFWFRSSEARISPQKDFVRLLSASVVKIQASSTTSFSSSFALIPHQQLLACIQYYYLLNARMTQALQTPPRLAEREVEHITDIASLTVPGGKATRIDEFAQYQGHLILNRPWSEERWPRSLTIETFS